MIDYWMIIKPTFKIMPKLSILDRYTKLSFPSSLVKKFMVSEIKNKSYVIDTAKENAT